MIAAVRQAQERRVCRLGRRVLDSVWRLVRVLLPVVVIVGVEHRIGWHVRLRGKGLLVVVVTIVI